ncbi:MAG: VWA domain-containing protein, partial [candidate division Zixibacteria bacterium]|nr:VWA domain-containing protein [candidate division Zixibacteria bacterium]
SLIIFFVVLAFARPSSRSGFTSQLGAKSKSTILFLMDNSYRMGYETKNGNLLSTSIKKGEVLLKVLREGDELYLITYSSEPKLYLSHPIFDSSLIVKGIREMELSFEPADLDKALRAGLDLLTKVKNENREIYLFTDLETKELFPLKRWSSAYKDKGIKLFIVKLTDEEKENWVIKKVELPERVLEKQTPFEVKGVVVNYSQKPAQNLLLSLYLDGKRVSQTGVDLKEREEREISFMQSVKESGVHSGYLEVSDDNLLADNRRFFTFNLPEKIEVLLVESKSEKEKYLRLALNPKIEEDRGIEVTRIDPKSFSRSNLLNYKAIIFSDYNGLKSEDLSRLDEFINSGRGVFFFLGEGEKEIYSQICQKYLNSTYKGRKEVSGKGEGFLTLEKIDLLHPVFQSYKSLDKTKFPQIKFFSINEITPGKKIKILASFSNGAPAFVENISGSGKVLAFLSSYDPGFSDFGEHTLFVPLIRRSVEYLSSSLFTSEQYSVGEKIRKEYDLKKAEKIELLDPENLRVILNPEYSKDKIILKLDGLKKPSIYRLQSGEKLLDQLAVNLDPKDSDLEPLKDAELKTEIKERDNIFVIKPDQDLGKEVLKTRYGKELRKNFLWLALGLIILEMVISKSRKKDLEYFENTGGEVAQRL